MWRMYLFLIFKIVYFIELLKNVLAIFKFFIKNAYVSWRG